MKGGRFDTDTAALIKRIATHEKYGSFDLNSWIYKHLELKKGLSIIDLGCGTGKQTLPMAELIGDNGHILAIDISREALDELSSISKQLGIQKRIRTLCVGLDDIGKHTSKMYFDRALASYSLYYAKDPWNVLEAVRNSLKPSGILFFCGPSKDNNVELKQFHYALLKEQPPVETGGSMFMEETGQQLAHKLFTAVEIFTFFNPLHFNSADSLYNYWSSYNLYDEKLDNAFKEAATKYFQINSVFETIKRVIGIKAVK